MNLIGPNWRTTFSMIGGVIMATLTFLSTVSYDQGAIALIIPQAYKPWVMKIAGGATLILFIYNGIKQKDKDVTGGNVQQTAGGNYADPGTQTLVDQTLLASKQSGEILTPEQNQIAVNLQAEVKSKESNP